MHGAVLHSRVLAGMLASAHALALMAAPLTALMHTDVRDVRGMAPDASMHGAEQADQGSGEYVATSAAGHACRLHAC